MGHQNLRRKHRPSHLQPVKETKEMHCKSTEVLRSAA
jgi:hypothetical protein